MRPLNSLNKTWKEMLECGWVPPEFLDEKGNVIPTPEALEQAAELCRESGGTKSEEHKHTIARVLMRLWLIFDYKDQLESN
jgi:hypothetical protein